jgi:AbrB family looped-hinge helix DNA binding protein
MARIKVRQQREITLPREICEVINLREGDDLEAEVVKGNILLRPVTAAERDAAWRRAEEAMQTVQYVGAQPEPTADQVMEEAVHLVKEVRREMARERRARRR